MSTPASAGALSEASTSRTTRITQGDLGLQVAGLLHPAVLVAVRLVRVPLVRAAVDPGDAIRPASAFRLRWRPVSSEQLLRW